MSLITCEFEDRDMETENEVDEDVFFKNSRKNLFQEFSKSVNTNLNVGEEHMKVYLRIRPFTEAEDKQKENQKCLVVQDDNTVSANAPKDSNTYRNCTHGLGKTTHKFTFSRIFKDTTGQKELFNDTMLGLVKDFIDGQNCLVFTYGVTSSGKTYTIQGKPSDAGILPRALDVLFNSINGKQLEGLKLKPNMFMDVVRLSAEEETLERKTKEKTLKMGNDEEPDVMSLLGDDASDISQATNTTTCSENSNFSYILPSSKESLQSDDIFTDLENRIREEAAVSVEDQGKICFSIWVSFAEIYNEQIFDLLVPIPKKKNTRRPVLKLSDDRNGSPYIKGLKEINVTSADEAYRLLTIGQQNLRTACTKLNHQSSRSHCIFNIKIVRVVDVSEPNIARVSMLSLCDLAGSERYSKTHNTGERLKEAGNINTSLMTLGRCIEMLRYNQHHKEKPKIIPFRDSKLTRLFQNFFCGRGKAAMIVNVNQCASLFDETLHVFKFSAIAKQVQVIQKPIPLLSSMKPPPPPPPPVRTSIAWETPGSSLKSAENLPLPEGSDDEMCSEDETYELMMIIQTLHEKLKAERVEKIRLEGKIREEVCKEMGEQFVAIEKACRERIKETEVMAEEMVEKRVKILMNGLALQKKHQQENGFTDEDDEWVSSILLHQEKVKVQDKEKEVEALKLELEHAKSAVGKQNESSHDMGNSILLETLSEKLQDAQERNKLQEEEIAKLNEMLEEAGETFAQKDKMIEELEKALEDSRMALTCADQRLTKQEKSIDSMQEEKQKLSDEFSTLQSCVTFMEQTVKQKEDEVQSWKNRCSRAEEDSLKQEQALINGYKAEITNLKQQISSLKVSKNEEVKSPEKKCMSPKKRIKSEEETNDFTENLAQQLKDLQSELDNTSSAMSELQQALQISRSTVEDLEKRLEQERENRVEAERKLVDQEENNNELEMLRNKISGLENSFEDREQNLATKVEENLKAEALIEEIQGKLKALEEQNYPAQIEEQEKMVSSLREELEMKKADVEKLEGTVEEYETLNRGLKDMLSNTVNDLQTKETKIQEMTPQQTETLEKEFLELKENMKQSNLDAENIAKECEKQKTENDALSKAISDKDLEIQTLKDEITDISSQLQQVQEDLEKEHSEKSFQMAESIAKECEEQKVENDALLKATSDKDLEIQTLKDEITDISSQLQQVKEDLEKELGEKSFQVVSLNAELSETKIDLATKMTDRERIIENMNDLYEKLQRELDEKSFEAKNLQMQLNKITKENEQKRTSEAVEQQEEKSQLETALQERESQITELNTKLELLQVELETKTNVVLDLEQNMKLLEKNVQENESDNQKKIHEIELGQVKVTLAETKSSLHMTQTLHQRAKKELLEKDRVIEELENSHKKAEKEKVHEQIDKFQKEKDKLLKELSDISSERDELLEEVKDVREQRNALAEEINTMRDQVSSLESQIKVLQENIQKKDQEIHDLDNNHQKDQRIHDLEEDSHKKEKKIYDLEEDSHKKDQQIHDLEDGSHKKDKRIHDLEEELKQIEDDIKSLSELRETLQIKSTRMDKLSADCDSLKKELASSKDTVSQKERLITDLQKQNVVTETSGNIDSLHKSLEREKTRNEEYQKLLNEMKLKECLSPTSESNSVRQLRKEKIESNNTVIELRYKVECLQKQLSDKEYGGCKEQKSVQELKETIVTLEKKCSDLEGTLRRREEIVVASPCRTEQLQRSNSCLTSPTVHRELNRSQEREQNLRKQLQQASSTIQEMGDKISDLEQQIGQKIKVIQQNEDNIQQLKSQISGGNSTLPGGDVNKLEEELKERWNQIQDLQGELMKKDQKLQVKVQALKELKSSIQTERDEFEAALRDARANESLIETLKNAMAEQEDTMEKQDSYLHRKEEEIKDLSRELEKYTEKYRQLLETNGDSGREMREITKENAKLMADYQQQTRTLQDQENVVRKLSNDREKLSSIIQENNKELKDMEKQLSECREENEKLKQQQESNVNEQMKTSHQQHKEEVEDLRNKIRERDLCIRETHRGQKQQDEELKNVKLSLKSKEEEIKTINRSLKTKEEELTKWRAERDTLVAGLEGLMKKQQAEIGHLKEENQFLEERLGHKTTKHQEQDEAVWQQVSVPSPRKQETAGITRHASSARRQPPPRPVPPVIPPQSLKGKVDIPVLESEPHVLSPRRRNHGEHELNDDLSEHRSRSAHKRSSRHTSSSKHHEGESQVMTPTPTRHHSESDRKPRSRRTRHDDNIDDSLLRSAESIRTSTRRGRKRRSMSESDIQLPSKREVKDNDITFASEDSSISDHLQIDATPPVAARNLRKNRKKRSSVDVKDNNSKPEKENKGPARQSRTKGSALNSGLQRIGSAVSLLKPTAKKLLDDIKEVSSPKQEALIEVEDHGTQMSPQVQTEPKVKRSRKKHQLYASDISEPMQFGSMIIPTESPDDSHTIVQRKLRGRRH